MNWGRSPISAVCANPVSAEIPEPGRSGDRRARTTAIAELTKPHLMRSRCCRMDSTTS